MSEDELGTCGKKERILQRKGHLFEGEKIVTSQRFVDVSHLINLLNLNFFLEPIQECPIQNKSLEMEDFQMN